LLVTDTVRRRKVNDLIITDLEFWRRRSIETIFGPVDL